MVRITKNKIIHRLNKAEASRSRELIEVQISYLGCSAVLVSSVEVCI